MSFVRTKAYLKSNRYSSHIAPGAVRRNAFNRDTASPFIYTRSSAYARATALSQVAQGRSQASYKGKHFAEAIRRVVKRGILAALRRVTAKNTSVLSYAGMFDVDVYVQGFYLRVFFGVSKKARELGEPDINTYWRVAGQGGQSLSGMWYSKKVGGRKELYRVYSRTSMAYRGRSAKRTERTTYWIYDVATKPRPWQFVRRKSPRFVKKEDVFSMSGESKRTMGSNYLNVAWQSGINYLRRWLSMMGYKRISLKAETLSLRTGGSK